MQHSSLISVRVSPDIAERLQRLGQLTNRSKSYLAAEALEEYLDLHEWQVQAIQEGIEEVNRGEVLSLEAVKQEWKQRLEDSSH